MSWFKRGADRRTPQPLERGQSDTDPNTCLEVFQNHWKQAWTVMCCQDKKATMANGQATPDGVETVLRNLEQMVTLLVNEDDDGGLPGPILRYVLESELLEKMCIWCTLNVPVHDKLRMQQLKLYELIISQSRQQLLIHRPVIKPLLRLLIDVSESHEILNGELEFKLVLVLHQICICISQQNLILESFFSTDTDHGPARFLIFSLLIPYIHREGPVGQKARDALLLIMTLSARHPHIGQYIANNSDFCPVLATGLSGLYSSLPRRITPASDDWCSLTLDDCLRFPDLQMFLNSLQFSNAVVQVAHPLVRKQLIDFIYSGFLVPVLAPALHQVSREEVMTATAYLDLFIRHVTDPHLLRAVVRFVLLEKYEDVPLLDTLLSRINSTSVLSSVTLALFQTLVDLNCEDVMFQLVFRYLVPCTHVMVSQRRSVRDLDLYSKSAEKFLSLRPKCCSQDSIPSLAPGTSSATAPLVTGVHSQTQRPSLSSIATIAGASLSSNPVSGEFGAEHSQSPWETNYFDYLHDARNRLEQTVQACHHWSFRYDGESPAPDSLGSNNEKASSSAHGKKQEASKMVDLAPDTGFFEIGSLVTLASGDDKNDKHQPRNKLLPTTLISGTLETPKQRVLFSEEPCNKVVSDQEADPKLYSSLDNVDTFISYLNEQNGAVDGAAAGDGKSMEENIQDLDGLIQSLPTLKSSGPSIRLNTPRSEAAQTTCLNEPTHSAANNSMDMSQSNNQAAWLSACEINALNKSAEPSSQQPDTAILGCVSIPKFDSDRNVDKGSGDFNKTSTGGLAPKSIVVNMNSERKVPKDFPCTLQSSPNPNLSSAIVFSPMKSAGDMLSPFRAALTPANEFPMTTSASPSAKKLNYLNDPPNIGPFLSALFTGLEGMINNSLYFNLLLTGVLSRLAAYPQPLLRSFLLNHNLVFQPSVKSLIQVLSSLRQKLDNYSAVVQYFDLMVASARQNLLNREQQLFQYYTEPTWHAAAVTNFLPPHVPKPRADTISTPTFVREKKKATLSDVFFRRALSKQKAANIKNDKKSQNQAYVHAAGSLDQPLTGARSALDVISAGHNPASIEAGWNQSVSAWNAVYCALILDEFLKELAALSQEHTVLHADEGYHSS